MKKILYILFTFTLLILSCERNSILKSKNGEYLHTYTMNIDSVQSLQDYLVTIDQYSRLKTNYIIINFASLGISTTEELDFITETVVKYQNQPNIEINWQSIFPVASGVFIQYEAHWLSLGCPPLLANQYKWLASVEDFKKFLSTPYRNTIEYDPNDLAIFAFTIETIEELETQIDNILDLMQGLANFVVIKLQSIALNQEKLTNLISLLSWFQDYPSVLVYWLPETGYIYPEIAGVQLQYASQWQQLYCPPLQARPFPWIVSVSDFSLFTAEGYGKSVATELVEPILSVLYGEDGTELLRAMENNQKCVPPYGAPDTIIFNAERADVGNLEVVLSEVRTAKTIELIIESDIHNPDHIKSLVGMTELLFQNIGTRERIGNLNAQLIANRDFIAFDYGTKVTPTITIDGEPPHPARVEDICDNFNNHLVQWLIVSADLMMMNTGNHNFLEENFPFIEAINPQGLLYFRPNLAQYPNPFMNSRAEYQLITFISPLSYRYLNFAIPNHLQIRIVVEGLVFTAPEPFLSTENEFYVNRDLVYSILRNTLDDKGFLFHEQNLPDEFHNSMTTVVEIGLNGRKPLDDELQ